MNSLRITPEEASVLILSVTDSHRRDIVQNEEIKSVLSENKHSELMMALIGIYFSLFSLIVSQRLKGEPLNRYGGIVLDGLLKMVNSTEEFQSLNIDKTTERIKKTIKIIVNGNIDNQLQANLKVCANLTGFDINNINQARYLVTQYMVCSALGYNEIKDMSVPLFLSIWIINSSVLSSFFEQFKNLEPSLLSI